MVIKGKARGGPIALAKHLERRDTNERVFVRDLRGVTARDVEGALCEMDCMGAGAVSTRTLYHAAINTAPNERLTDDQKEQAVARLEKELGFEGQPRIVVEHLKKGREHIHAVFLRIDTDRMVAISDSHNYRRHEIVARDLEHEFGHKRVQGAHIGRGDQERPQRTPAHAEMQQAERSGLSAKAAKEKITHLWHQADNGMAFAAAVKKEGWALARGDKRDFVLIDPAGEPHSLARRIEGAKAVDVRQRMADVDPSKLPSVAEAKAIQKAPVPAISDKRKIEKEVATAGPTIKPVLVETVSRPVSRHIQTKDERIAALAEATSGREAAPAKQIRETLNLKEKPRPTKLQRLYGSAVKTTQRVVAKAKGLFEKKPSRVQDERLPQPAPNPLPRRPVPKKAASMSPPPPLPQVRKPDPKTPTPIRKRPSREELDEMIGRQRQHRHERGGPAR